MHRLARLVPAVFALVLMAAPASAQVKDDGKLFGDRAEKEADAVIAGIKQKYHKEVRVEGYSQPPANRAAEFEQRKKDRAWRERFFKSWAEERMRSTRTKRVFVLIFRDKDGYYSETTVGSETLKKDFEHDDI